MFVFGISSCTSWGRCCDVEGDSCKEELHRFDRQDKWAVHNFNYGQSGKSKQSWSCQSRLQALSWSFFSCNSCTGKTNKPRASSRLEFYLETRSLPYGYFWQNIKTFCPARLSCVDGLQCLGTAMWTGSSGRSSIKCTARSLYCTKLQWVFFTQHHKVLIEVGRHRCSRSGTLRRGRWKWRASR